MRWLWGGDCGFETLVELQLFLELSGVAALDLVWRIWRTRATLLRQGFIAFLPDRLRDHDTDQSFSAACLSVRHACAPLSRTGLLRCSPAGSDCACRDGHGIASVFLLVNVNPVVGGCAGGDVGEGVAGPAKPMVHISTGILLRRPGVACDSQGFGAGAPRYRSRARNRCRPSLPRRWQR